MMGNKMFQRIVALATFLLLTLFAVSHPVNAQTSTCKGPPGIVTNNPAKFTTNCYNIAVGGTCYVA